MGFRVIRRSEWGATPAEGPNANRRITTPAPELWIHHTAGPAGNGTQADEARLMRAIQALHKQKARAKGWKTIDIAYTHVVFPTARIFEGRGWGLYGNHTQNHNTVSHAVCFAGDFRTAKPTDAALDACRWLIGEGRRVGAVRVGITLPTGGHRDVVSTACPGSNLYAAIAALRSTGGDDDMAIDAKYHGVLERVAQGFLAYEKTPGASTPAFPAAVKWLTAELRQDLDAHRTHGSAGSAITDEEIRQALVRILGSSHN